MRVNEVSDVTYRVFPTGKRNAIENVVYVNKKGWKITHVIVWRNCSVFMNQKPDPTTYDPKKCVDVFNTWDCELDSCEDSMWDDWEFDKKIPPATVNKIKAAIEEDGELALENLGFESGEGSLWFTGPLKVTKA